MIIGDSDSHTIVIGNLILTARPKQALFHKTMGVLNELIWGQCKFLFFIRFLVFSTHLH